MIESRDGKSVVGWWSQNCLCSPRNTVLARKELSGSKKKKISLESSISTGQLVKGELFGYGLDCLFGKRCFFVLILFCPFVNM